MPAIPCFPKEVCPPQPCRRHGCGDRQGVTYIRRGVSTVVCRYTYDSLGQLTREDNSVLGKTYVWTYDKAGNILSRKTYAYTIGTLGAVQNTVTYGYDTGNWGDLLISFNGQSIAYDGIGNPGTWNGSALTWQGRRLMSYGSNTYTYNADGIRTSKTVNGVEHIYHLSGTQILDEEWIEGNIRHLMVYVYDASGQPIGISHYTYNGTIVSENYYLLVSNIQGDIIGIYDSNGTRVVTYVYDAWGRILSTTGTGANTIGVYNPFRYRGYYYDTETSLYYLNSRFYDPNVGRFLNVDGSVNANGDLIGFNLFAYCENNPVMGYDPSGEWSWIAMLEGVVLSAAVTGICAIAIGATLMVLGATGVGGIVLGVIAAGIASGAYQSFVYSVPKENGESLTVKEIGDVAISSVESAVTQASGASAVAFGASKTGSTIIKTVVEESFHVINFAFGDDCSWRKAQETTIENHMPSLIKFVVKKIFGK